MSWRDLPPTEAQLAVLRKYRIGEKLPETRGEACDRIAWSLRHPPQKIQRYRDLNPVKVRPDDPVGRAYDRYISSELEREQVDGFGSDDRDYDQGSGYDF